MVKPKSLIKYPVIDALDFGEEFPETNSEIRDFMESQECTNSSYRAFYLTNKKDYPNTCLRLENLGYIEKVYFLFCW